MEREAAVRKAFADQAVYCERLGSPFTARLCAVLGESLDRRHAIGARLLDWPGDPAATADGVPLRLCGGLHALVRSGDAPELARLYPPAQAPSDDALRSALESAFAKRSDELLPWLERAPQTNEVGRSAVLMAGLLVVAERFPLPISLYELGASAGLNLLLDHYRHDLGGRRAGALESAVELAPEWKGPPPPDAAVTIVERAGVDLHPADALADRERLIAYVWPDQERRLRQIEAALAVAAVHPPRIEQGDAAGWLETHLPVAPTPGRVRTVMHSVAFQYFPAETQARVAAHIEAAGATASEESPVVWLRFEKEAADPAYSLRLRAWPGEERLLAWVHPHGAKVEWVG